MHHKTIKAKTKYGIRTHGVLVCVRPNVIYFVRHCRPNYVRWSAGSFRVNTSVLDEIKEAKVWQFHYQTDKGVKVYSILADEALKCQRGTDEDGQVDVLVPIIQCQLEGIIQNGKYESIEEQACLFNSK